MKKTDITVLGQENTFELIGKQWMLITAGSKSRFNTMTASWGGLGVLWNKNVATIYVRPSRYTHEFLLQHDRVTLTFLPESCRNALRICGSKSGRDSDKVAEAGLTPIPLESGAMTFGEARLVLDCRKLYVARMAKEDFTDSAVFDQWYAHPDEGGLHTVCILEIENVYTNPHDGLRS